MLKQVTWLRRIVLSLLLLIVGAPGLRLYNIQRGPELQLWHTWVLHEMDADEIDNVDWNDYVNKENALFSEIKRQITDKLDAERQTELNRYYSHSPIYPGSFPTGWSWSYITIPDGRPKGAAVLLYGLTDTPYSLRHIAENYRQQGYVAIGIRLPGHETVPAGLTDVNWQGWLAVTRLAVKEAERLTGNDVPLHIVGFSNGDALTMKYSLDALDDAELTRPQRVILISPMIDITSFARFSGLISWPAFLLTFSKAAWLNIMPGFNLFKYNSFPTNAARQPFLLTRALQKQIAADSRNYRLSSLPPVLTFQSVVDSTVSTRAVAMTLYNCLPENGSEIVLFGSNHAVRFNSLLRRTSHTALARLLTVPPRAYQTTIITNVNPAGTDMEIHATPAGKTDTIVEKLQGVRYLLDVYSLFHVALLFPLSDSLYGRYPHPLNQYGISLGTFAARGERSVLVVGLDLLMRQSSNPFFPYMIKRIDEGIGTRPALSGR